MMEKHLNIKISDMRLSVRALNVLAILEVKDVYDLLNVEHGSILKQRNVGEKTMKEILRMQRILRSIIDDLNQMVIDNP